MWPDTGRALQSRELALCSKYSSQYASNSGLQAGALVIYDCSSISVLNMTHFGLFVFGFSNLTFSLGILMICLSTFLLFSLVLELDKVVLRRVVCSFVSNKI